MRATPTTRSAWPWVLMGLLCWAALLAGPARTQAGLPSAPPPGREFSPLTTEMKTTIHFASRSSRISPGSAAELKRVVKKAERLNAGLGLAGHTDSVEARGASTGLSKRRVEAVRDYLKRQGLNPDDNRLWIKAHGASRPAASNSTGTGRAKNRRVEVVLYEVHGG
jgi:outer membrane protein OmpA-like peptidoglycan-associated protein